MSLFRSPLPALSLSTFGAIASSPLLTCPNTNVRRVVPNTSIGTFLGTYRLTLSTLTPLYRLACLAIAVSCVLGEFCILCPIQRILTFLVVFSAIFALFSTMWASMNPLDASVQFLKPSECCFAASIGESGSLACSRGILTFSGAFADLFMAVPMLGTAPIPLDTSVWLPTPSVTSTPRFVSPVPRYVPVTHTSHLSFV